MVHIRKLGPRSVSQAAYCESWREYISRITTILIQILRTSKTSTVINPRWGTIHDTIRQCNVDNDTAHPMAVAAMEQIWLVYRIAEHSATIELATPEKTIVFSLPVLYTLLYSAHTWGITSYTIAAWIEAKLHFDLLLHKSVDCIFIDGIIQNGYPCLWNQLLSTSFSFHL